MITLLVPVVAPVLGALTYVVLGWRRSTAWVSAASAAAMLVTAIVLAVDVTDSGPRTVLGGLLRADALSAFMLIVIGAVALLATIATPAYLRAEIDAERATARTATRHSVLVQLFLAAMALAVLAANLGVVWVAIEATTIVTAFLVGQRRTKAAVEAAWKYVVICSAGIALALLGTIVLNFAASRAPGGAIGLDLAALAAHASSLDPGVTRIAVVLLILGFGTKAGLAPLHAWLPDAHSQAPAPVSALMSGVLLSVAFYAILRVTVIADAALGTGFARTVLAVMAVASLLVAATLLLAQRDYKRMLAYSSIEHLGLVALGTALGGPLALAAVLLHILGHGLAKAVLFLGAGRILQVTGTSRINDIRGLAGQHPVLAGCVGAGVLALIGLPPFSLFASELGIARAGFAAEMGWVTAAALAIVLVIAAALVGHTSRMLLGTPPDGPGAASAPQRVPLPTAVALVGGLLACAALGITAGPLSTLLHLAADTLVRAPR
nr:proton-conducting transporter membrane subunit [Kibdelosporangium sp. MJ126-NF4]CEL19762.1 Hydrogenase-4 component F [Kibdelosporangium sp. MJ126-NF4]CTQ96987.1 Hydrogenase-4 component F [Kibdelosporangium sp. MJ126-NF4]